MGLREIFAAGSLAFDKIGHRIQSEPIHPEVQPEIENLEGSGFHGWIVIIQIGLMKKEAVPEIGFGNWIVGPVAHLRVFEDDSGFCVFGWIVGPDIVIAPRISRGRATRFLEPEMLIARVIQHKFGNHAQPILVGDIQELFEVIQGAVGGIDGEIVSDIIPIVPEGRRVERQKPDRGNAKIFEIIELTQQSLKISDAVIVRIAKGFNMQLIDDGFFEPERRWRLNRFRSLDLGCLNLHRKKYVRSLTVGVRVRRTLAEVFHKVTPGQSFLLTNSKLRNQRVAHGNSPRSRHACITLSTPMARAAMR
jgi:hypothetical protein